MLVRHSSLSSLSVCAQSQHLDLDSLLFTYAQKSILDLFTSDAPLLEEPIPACLLLKEGLTRPLPPKPSPAMLMARGPALLPERIPIYVAQSSWDEVASARNVEALVRRWRVRGEQAARLGILVFGLGHERELGVEKMTLGRTLATSCSFRIRVRVRVPPRKRRPHPLRARRGESKRNATEEKCSTRRGNKKWETERKIDEKRGKEENRKRTTTKKQKKGKEFLSSLQASGHRPKAGSDDCVRATCLIY